MNLLCCLWHSSVSGSTSFCQSFSTGRASVRYSIHQRKAGSCSRHHYPLVIRQRASNHRFVKIDLRVGRVVVNFNIRLVQEQSHTSGLGECSQRHTTVETTLACKVEQDTSDVDLAAAGVARMGAGILPSSASCSICDIQPMSVPVRRGHVTFFDFVPPPTSSCLTGGMIPRAAGSLGTSEHTNPAKFIRLVGFRQCF